MMSFIGVILYLFGVGVFYAFLWYAIEKENKKKDIPNDTDAGSVFMLSVMWPLFLPFILGAYAFDFVSSKFEKDTDDEEEVVPVVTEEASTTKEE